jgi:hypothetical protein
MQRFVASCKMCETETCELHVLRPRAVNVGDPTAPDDIGICKGCPCSVGKCDSCGETGGHWLGCDLVGMPTKEEHDASVRPPGATLQ